MKRSGVLTALFLIAALAVTACAQAPAAPAANSQQSSELPPPQKVEPPYPQFSRVAEDGTKEFFVWVQEIDHEIMPGVKVRAWAFNGTLPGPEIRVNQGDKVRVYFKNTHGQPHTIHFHGQTDVSMKHDGVPDLTSAVLPSGEHVYEFTANTPGTHMYHCHFQTYRHVDFGMYGALIVEPKGEAKNWDKEYTFILDEWDPDLGTKWIDKDYRPNYRYFTINGKAFPHTQAIEGKPGERIKVRFINMGYELYSMHLHGYSFKVTHWDGFPLKNPYLKDTVPVSPGERVDLVFTLKEGIYPFHDHNLNHTINDGEYLGGATLLVNGGPEEEHNGH